MLYTSSLHNMSMIDISQFSNFLIGGYSLYNAALVSAIQPHGSEICIHVPLTFELPWHAPHLTRLGG